MIKFGKGPMPPDPHAVNAWKTEWKTAADARD